MAKLNKNFEQYKKHLELYMAQLMENSIYPYITKFEPRKMTAKEKKAHELAKLKEKKRRAKKITMTVGELEDKLEAQRDYYND
jgi:hypothetical protein